MKKEVDFNQWFAVSRELAEKTSGKMKASHLMIYFFMKDDSYFHLEERQQSEYRPSLAAIAKCTGNTEKIVRAALLYLIELGLLVKEADATSRAGAAYRVIDFRQVPDLMTEKSNKEEREAYVTQKKAEQPEPILDVQKCTPIEEAIAEAVANNLASLPDEQKCLPTLEQSNAQFCAYVGNPANEPEESKTGNPGLLTLAEAQEIWKQEGKPAYIIKSWSQEFVNTGSFIRPTLNIHWTIKE
ncbi:hypothetical protein DLC15_06325 [Salmonella enterica subsp. enterica serovar Telelkebir]|nr:hypothetical protein [Salmonella enterica subsp. enterica serovar Telelkebir]